MPDDEMTDDEIVRSAKHYISWHKRALNRQMLSEEGKYEYNPAPWHYRLEQQGEQRLMLVYTSPKHRLVTTLPIPTD